MTPTDAAKLLDLPADASPEQLEARFHELRTKLEEKIGKAPTPGLKAKYRVTLDEITQAFETLTLAADSSTLPVTRKQSVGGEAISPAEVVSTPSSPLHAPRSGGRKSGGKEFALVAIIALVVLAGGGWFVLKTRAENAEKARIAAEQQAAADRQAEEARLAAEAKKKADEEEKARVATAAKAEQERLEKLAAQVRVGFSESKLLWQQAERAEREAQRELDDLKSTARSMRDVPAGQRREIELRLEAQTDYQRWLTDFLARHPARRAEVRTEELLNTRQTGAAAEALAQYQQALAGLSEEITARRPKPDDLYGSLVIVTEPAGIPWKLTDAFGNIMSGKTPGTADRVAAGPATVSLQRQDWEENQLTVSVTAGKATRAEFVYRPASLQFTSTPPGAEVFLDGNSAGRTPLTVPNLPDRTYGVELRLVDHKPWTESVKLSPGEKRNLEATLNKLNDQEFIAQCSTRWSGTWSGTLRGTLFYCKFVAGNTHYVQWNGSGKYANNPPAQIDLVLVSRAPLVLDQILKFPAGRVGLDGSTGMKVGRLKEQDGQLIYVALSPNGRNMTECVMQRTGQ